MPPLEELQRFNACAAAADEDEGGGGGGGGASAAGTLEALIASIPHGSSAPKTAFVKGDPIVFTKGACVQGRAGQGSQG